MSAIPLDAAMIASLPLSPACSSVDSLADDIDSTIHALINASRLRQAKEEKISMLCDRATALILIERALMEGDAESLYLLVLAVTHLADIRDSVLLYLRESL